MILDNYHPGYVYLVRLSDGSAKVGHSGRPWGRLAGLSKGQAYLTHVIQGDMFTEQAIHRQLRRFKKPGTGREWYRSHDELQPFFAPLRTARCRICGRRFGTVFKLSTAASNQRWRGGPRFKTAACSCCGQNEYRFDVWRKA